MKRITASALLCIVASFGFSRGNGGEESVGGLLSDSTYSVREVVITSKQASREVIPAQTLSGEQLERLGNQSVADAMRYFSGLQIKDYGGVGGIKTVNIRSMGTNHLGVFYDGIQLGNAQNGQTDLGQLSLDNVEEITLYNGQKSAIFQSATDFGNAGSVYIRTRVPQFEEGKTSNLRAKVKYGSSDMLRVSGLYERRLSDKLSASLSAGVLSASGKYKFRYKKDLPDGSVAYDTTATRQNGDILALRLEANIHGRFADGTWAMKAYTYHSERGIPGAIVSNVWRRGERQGDRNTFVQGHIQRAFGHRFMTKLQAKYGNYHTHHVNRDTTRRIIDDTFRQQELFVSSANVLELTRRWSISAAYDLRYNTLSADVIDFARPRRLAHAVAIATAIDFPRVKIQGSLMGDFVKDHEKRASVDRSWEAFSPAVFVNVYPFRSPALSLRAFVKKSFRMPTFNDLYYTDIGNALLKPETATQYNVGAVWEHRRKGAFMEHLRLKCDAYYNNVEDKIVAYPKGQQFRWTMLNLGEVDIRGIDAEAEIGLRPAKDLRVAARAQYTWQQTEDLSDARMPYYKQQIPYIPQHSGSATVAISWRRLDIDYSFIYAGERYNQRENIAANRMQPWYTSDIAVSWRFKWQKTKCRLSANVNNLLDQHYDVIVNYPMPGRNFAVGMDVEW